MKSAFQRFVFAAALLGGAAFARAQSTAFTYQGCLDAGGVPANGYYDMQFSLYGYTGVQLGPTFTELGVGVSNGLFSVTLDFGSQFTGAPRWLGLAVRTNGVGGYEALTPRQPLNATPYAIFAGSASNLAGSLPAGQLSGTIPLATLPATVMTNGESGTSLAGVALLASDNTFSGNQIIDGTVRLNNDLSLNDHLIYLNAISDGLGYWSGLPFFYGGNGPFLFGFEGGALGTVEPTEINLAWDAGGNVWISNSLAATTLVVDRAGLNNGNIAGSLNAITFGAGSGEGIASKRTAGGNQYGLDFYADFQNRMSIVNSGFVGINTTTPSETLEINGTARLDDNDVYLRAGSDRNHGLGHRTYLQTGPATNQTYLDGPFLYGYGGGGLGVSGPETMMVRWLWNGEVDIYSNLVVNNFASKPGGGSWSSLSDIRLKKNVKPLEGALDKLLALHGVTFEFQEPSKIHELSGERMGMIAQEVEEVFPDWVETGADGYKRLTFRGFEALTVEAVRELQAESDQKIAALQQQLAKQEARNDRNEAQLATLQQAVERLTAQPADRPVEQPNPPH